jgi:predicted  nucleic acid-binding Zn-ribbon protein
VAETALAVEADDVDRALAPARDQRDALAARVTPDVLVAYDRVRRRKPTHAVVALRGAACSACDTAMPVQRQRAMVAQGRIEVCEGCGVLLFAPS